MIRTAVLLLFTIFASLANANPLDVCVHDVVFRGYQPSKPRLSEQKLRSLAAVPARWRPINIQFDYTGLDGLDSAKKDFLINDLLPKVSKFVSTFLSVKYVPGEKWAYPEGNCHKVNIPARYRQPVLEADLLVFVTWLDQPRLGYRAWASSCLLDPITERPKAGQMNFNLKTLVEMADKREFKEMFHTTIHELTHVLGLTAAHFTRFIDENGRKLGADRVIKKVTMRGYPTSVVILPKVRDYVRTFFNCPDAEGAEVENQGEPGSLGSHWERRVFMNEYMTSSNRKDAKISYLTLALLEGSGWYQVDYSVAGELTFGKGAGCDFLKKPCYVNGRPQHKHWCPRIPERSEGCDHKHMSKSSCYLKEEGTRYNDRQRDQTLPQAFNYFNGRIAQDHFCDNCPYYKPFSDGHCGFAENHREKEFGWMYDETFGPGSRCFEGNYIKEKAKLKNAPPNHGTCHKYRCQKTSNGRDQVVVSIGKTEVVCPAQGGQQSIPGYKGTINCPAGDEFCADKKANDCPNKNYCSEIGVCYSGRCICPVGFENETCQEVKLDCKKTNCNNHGTCRKGYCECNDGWGGAECAQPRATTGCRICGNGNGICYGGQCLNSLSDLSAHLQNTGRAAS